MEREMDRSRLVTVIIPVYNGIKFLEETVKSIQRQTHQNWELLIVDDCSTDNTPDLAAKLASEDSRIQFVRLETNFGGPARPRNVGLSIAQGEFVAFCDADDLWSCDKIERQLAVLRSQRASVIGGALQNFSGGKTKFVDFNLRNEPEQITNISFLGTLINSNLRISSVMVETWLAKGIMFDETRYAQAREDYLFVLKAIERSGSAIKIKSVIGGYRIHDRQISANKIEMLIKHFRVLFSYELDNKKRIGFFAFLLTLTHFSLAFCKHVSKKPF